MALAFGLLNLLWSILFDFSFNPCLIMVYSVIFGDFDMLPWDFRLSLYLLGAVMDTFAGDSGIDL